MKHLFTFLTLITLLAGTLFVTSTNTFAAVGDSQNTGDMPGGITNPTIGNLGDDPEAASEGSTFARYFIVVWQGLITVGSIFMLAYFLWAAIDWIVAGGDSSKIQKARDKMTNAVIGLVLLVGSFAIIGFIGSVFFGDQFNILAPTFFDPLAYLATTKGIA